jgi:putative Mn2+ efflux pump MntP
VAGARLWAPPGYQDLDYSDQFRGLFVLALVTLVGPATVRVVFAMTGPAAGSNTANIGAATAVLTVGARSVGAASNLVRHRNQGGNNR